MNQIEFKTDLWYNYIFQSPGVMVKKY